MSQIDVIADPKTIKYYPVGISGMKSMLMFGCKTCRQQFLITLFEFNTINFCPNCGLALAGNTMDESDYNHV